MTRCPFQLFLKWEVKTRCSLYCIFKECTCKDALVLEARQEPILVAIIVFSNGCTCKDALVLEARQEGQGIYTTCQSLCHHFNPRATGSPLFCACAAEIG